MNWRPLIAAFVLFAAGCGGGAAVTENNAQPVAEARREGVCRFNRDRQRLNSLIGALEGAGSAQARARMVAANKDDFVDIAARAAAYADANQAFVLDCLRVGVQANSALFVVATPEEDEGLRMRNAALVERGQEICARRTSDPALAQQLGGNTCPLFALYASAAPAEADAYEIWRLSARPVDDQARAQAARALSRFKDAVARDWPNAPTEGPAGAKRHAYLARVSCVALLHASTFVVARDASARAGAESVARARNDMLAAVYAGLSLAQPAQCAAGAEAGQACADARFTQFAATCRTMGEG